MAEMYTGSCWTIHAFLKLLTLSERARSALFVVVRPFLGIMCYFSSPFCLYNVDAGAVAFDSFGKDLTSNINFAEVFIVCITLFNNL